MTLRIVDAGTPEPQEATPAIEPNNSGSELYTAFVQALNAGGYTNGAVVTACACLAAHAADSAGWKRSDALPEFIRMFFQVEPVTGEKL